jgi:hypothetical protein
MGIAGWKLFGRLVLILPLGQAVPAVAESKNKEA